MKLSEMVKPSAEVIEIPPPQCIARPDVEIDVDLDEEEGNVEAELVAAVDIIRQQHNLLCFFWQLNERCDMKDRILGERAQEQLGEIIEETTEFIDEYND